MYQRFRDLLKKAVGRNEWVAAINADIRSFSSVMSGDPAQTGLYLRAVYGRILDRYFAKRSFFKPTGDGLLLVVPFQATERELGKITRSVVTDALRLHDDFADIIATDKLIKFPHPQMIGIGLSVGSVSRLMAEDLTLDYTGRALNVASRLMDLARPSGVVFDSTLDFTALTDDVRNRFKDARVYLKGVAEQDGVDVLYTYGSTQIPERYRKPLRPPARFEEEPLEFNRSQATQRGRFWLPLKHEPADRTGIELIVNHPRYRSGKRLAGLYSFFTPSFEYNLHRGRPHVAVDFAEIARKLQSAKVPTGTAARLTVAYPVDADVLEAAAADDDIPF
jgi:class 3 adenylate cyclase